MNDFNRRRFVKGAGALVVAGTLAGCSGDDGGSDDGSSDGSDGSDDGTDDGSDGSDDGMGQDADVPDQIHNYLVDGDANLYEGSIEDLTGQDEVTVNVGAGEGFAFDSPAVRIDSGATVVWEWTGQGGSHNVVSAEDSSSDFESDLMDAEGDTFEQSFDDDGIQLYFCSPHRGQGMLGAVEVVE